MVRHAFQQLQGLVEIGQAPVAAQRILRTAGLEVFPGSRFEVLQAFVALGDELRIGARRGEQDLKRRGVESLPHQGPNGLVP